MAGRHYLRQRSGRAGGPEFYRKAIIELDEEALGCNTMEKAFDQMQEIRGMVDPNFPGRDWNLATAMVINGQAGMQIMGDWAKGEWLNAGKEPSVDLLCFHYPGTRDVHLQLRRLRHVEGERGGAGRADQARQRHHGSGLPGEFNLMKGSIPARNDIPDTNFDACGKKAMADVKVATENNALMGSFAHGHAAPRRSRGPSTTW